MNTKFSSQNRDVLLWLIFTALFVISGLSKTASAAAIYKTGFENPPYTTARLVVINPDGSQSGQDGWTGVPVLSPNAARITTTRARQGKQSVVVRGALLESQPDAINGVTAGYYDALGSYRKTVDFDSLGRRTVRISAHVRVDGKKTADGNNFFSASITGRGADVLSTNGGGTFGVGELAISSDGHVYGYSGNEDVPGCNTVPCTPAASFLSTKTVSLNEWHKLAIDINFRNRTYSFSVDDACMGRFPMDPAFIGNYLRRGSIVAYAAPDTTTELKSGYSAFFDQLILARVDEREECIQ